MTRSGAGEMPSTSKGACGVASQMPHVASPLNPKLSRMTATAARIAPVQSIDSPGCAGTFFTRKLSTRFTTASATMSTNDHRQPIVVANQPARISASTPANGMAAARNPIARACCAPW